MTVYVRILKVPGEKKNKLLELIIKFLRDTKSALKSQLHSYPLTVTNPERKLRKESYLLKHPK